MTVNVDNDDMQNMIDDDFFEDENNKHNNEELPQSSDVQRQISACHQVGALEVGVRLDKLTAQVFAEHSRSQLQTWIADGSLQVDGKLQKAKYRVKVGEVLTLNATLLDHSEALPENIVLHRVYEDDEVLVIDKPVGMVVHPAVGNWTGTLVNALLYHYPEQSHLPRAGLVHRIDKDTSGLLIIGKTSQAQQHLMAQLKNKSVYRHYQCIVVGDKVSLSQYRTIDAPIGRHRTQRTKMAVTSQGKNAITHIQNIQPLNDNYCLLDVALETGRTHQIRVHLAHIGHPIIGDGVYGGHRQLTTGLSDIQRQAIQSFPRQALHAYELGFIHPTTGEAIAVSTPLAEDMQRLMEILSE